MMSTNVRPRRSVLFTPGSNPRALAKGTQVPADGLIFDLEDAVSPECKCRAREIITDAFATRQHYGKRELVIRVNGLDSLWGVEDLRAMSALGADAIVLPKVESARMVNEAVECIEPADRQISIWCMIETPRGVMRVEEIADHPQVDCLVMGTSDLNKDLRSLQTPQRLPMITSLSWCLLAARAADIAILDGVHLDLTDDDGFAQSCQQGREIGFDGKTLIHPKQIDDANRCFAPDEDMVTWSRRIIDAYESAMADGKGVTVVDGKLIENLHIVEAKRLLQLADSIKLQSG